MKQIKYYKIISSENYKIKDGKTYLDLLFELIKLDNFTKNKNLAIDIFKYPKFTRIIIEIYKDENGIEHFKPISFLIIKLIKDDSEMLLLNGYYDKLKINKDLLEEKYENMDKKQNLFINHIYFDNDYINNYSLYNNILISITDILSNINFNIRPYKLIAISNNDFEFKMYKNLSDKSTLINTFKSGNDYKTLFIFNTNRLINNLNELI